MNDFIEIGSISGFFGVKGWVKLYSYTRPRRGISAYLNCFLGDEKSPIRFTQIKQSGKYIIARIDGVDSRDEASHYVGQSLSIKRRDLPKLDNEYYWHELIGLTVVNRQDQVLGKITEMMETGANDVMVITSDSGGEILIPYAVSHFVLSVELDKQRLRVDWEINNDGETIREKDRENDG